MTLQLTGNAMQVSLSMLAVRCRTTTLNVAAYCALVSSISAGQQWNGQVAAARVDHYESDVGGGSDSRSKSGRSGDHRYGGQLLTLC